MSGQISFDWKTDEEEFDRQLARYGEGRPAEFFSDGERKLALIALRALVALAFVVLASGSAPFSLQQMDRMQLEQELSPMLELDAEAWRARDVERHNALIDPQVDRNWVGEWRDNWGARSETGHIYTLELGPIERFSDDLVQAEVYVTLPRTNWWQPAIRRETRFYRNIDGVWLRSLPPDSFWGQQRRLETASFTFYYYDADAESVRAAAQRLDGSYADLYRMLGLGPVPAEERAIVMVTPSHDYARSWGDARLNVHRLDRFFRRQVDVTSPILSQVPRGMSNTDYLTDRVFSRVTTDLLRDRRHIKMRYDWAFVTIVLRGWLVQQVLDEPNPWRLESATVFRHYVAGMDSVRLQDLDEFMARGQTGRDTVLWRYEAASSLLDYIVEREGVEVLPRLLQGFGEHSSWQNLIESVFDTTLEEFTDDWNQYLAQEYGL